MRYLLLPLLAAMLASCKPDGSNAKSEADPQADPVQVLETVIKAAKEADPSLLAGLCHPLAEPDQDTRAICGMTIDSKDFTEFKNAFSQATIMGPALIRGNTAKVKFRFGPERDEEETLTLRQVEGKWYLSRL